MKKRRRKNFIRVFLPKLIIMIVIALILLQLTVLGLRLRTEIQLREIAAHMELGHAELNEIGASGTVEDWKDEINCRLSMVEAYVYDMMPGAKAFSFLADLHGSKLDEPDGGLYAMFYKLDRYRIVSAGTYVCDREYLESIPELKEYLRSADTFKSESVWEDWTSKDFQYCLLSVNDGYVDPATHKFYLGNCVLHRLQTKFVGRNVSFMDDLMKEDPTTIQREEINLTPDDTTGLLKYASGRLTKNDVSEDETVLTGFWQDAGTDTYAEAMTCKNKHLDRSKSISVKIYDKDGREYQAFLIINTNMAEAYKEVLLFFKIFYPAIAILISLIWATVTYSKLKYFYINEDYRKALMNSMAHDLKTPLMAMSGYAENLVENVMTEKREHYAQAILQNTEYMSDIIADILNLSKLEDGSKTEERQKQDLVELMSDLKEEHEALIKEKNLNLILEGSFSRKIEKESMKRALDNLLTNAILYTNVGGTIHVTGRNNPLFGGFVIANSPVAPIKVKGAKLWEPFVKGDDSRSDRKGTGLGLSIAKSILESQGLTPKIKVKKDGFKVIVK